MSGCSAAAKTQLFSKCLFHSSRFFGVFFRFRFCSRVSFWRQWTRGSCRPFSPRKRPSPGSCHPPTGPRWRAPGWSCPTQALVKGKGFVLKALPLTRLSGNLIFQSSDPVPGACNMEFNLDTDPNVYVRYNLYDTTIRFAPANLGYER